MPNRRLFHALAAVWLMGLTCTAMAQAHSASDTKSGLSAADTVFIEDAAKSGMAEIQMAQTAVGKSTDDQVKALAQHIVDDHGKANDALKSLAETKKVSFPSGPTEDALKENRRLQTMKPAGFDQAWSKAMVKHHQDAIKLFTTEAKNTKDKDIQQFVKTTLPTLKSHLEAAQQIAAVPEARDQAMDQAAASMNSAMDGTPATASTAASTAPGTTAASPTVKATSPTAAPTTPAATPGAKH